MLAAPAGVCAGVSEGRLNNLLATDASAPNSASLVPTLQVYMAIRILVCGHKYIRMNACMAICIRVCGRVNIRMCRVRVDMR